MVVSYTEYGDIMSIRKSIVLFFILILVVSGGCLAAEETKTAIDQPILATIGDILENPDMYIGQNVTLNGTVTSQCGSGCWFIVSDETGDLYVTLRANDFVIPPSMGETVTVTGLVENEDDIFITGNQVIIGDTIYP
jgi:hypothetical protein